MMYRLKKAFLEELHWIDIRKEFAAVNPALSKIIDDLSPSKEYTLFKCKYPFGSQVLQNNGILYLPNADGVLVAINNDQIPQSTREKLGYNLLSNPVSMVLRNSAESFLAVGNSTIPLYSTITPGQVFGTWLILSDKTFHTPGRFLWSMTAGARSIFMLPKITEAIGFNRLKKEFCLKSEKPGKLLDHWRLFRELANQKNFGEDWSLEIIYFPKQWFEHLHDKKWVHFNYYLMGLAWQGSEYWRNEFTRDLIFSLIKREQSLKPYAHIDDIVKHLLGMGVGAVPGMAPSVDDTAGPISRLQEIFINTYHLEDYAPIIMQPQGLNLSNGRPIYYSQNNSPMLEFSPRFREGTTKLFDLASVLSLLPKYLSELDQSHFHLEGTLLHELPKKIQYDFFHTDTEHYADIRSSENIPKEDPAFLTKFLKTKNNKFPINSPFVRGCVRIKPKTKL